MTACDCWTREKIRNLVVHYASGPSPTCEERNVADADEWGLMKTTAVTWDGWNSAAHKVPPRHYWGNHALEILSGDVLITKAGPRNRCGVTVYVPETPRQLIVSGKMILLRPNLAMTNAPFLASALAAPAVQRFLDSRTTGLADAQLNFTNQLLLDTEVDVPNPEVQKRIAEILTTLDEAIEHTKTLIAKMQQVKTGLMHDLFTRGITPSGQLRPTREGAPELYKESPLGWIPKVWAIRSLNKLAHIDRGKFTIRPRNDPRYYGGTYPFIQTGDVALASGRVLTTYSQTLNDRGLGVSRLFPVGTIMVTIAANIADTCLLGISMCAPDSLVGIVPNTGEVARYLELTIRQRKQWFENRAPQTAQKNINLEDLKPLSIPYPDLVEQTRIADRYQLLDESLMEEEQTYKKLQLLKHGLMHDLLTGRVRVMADVCPESARATVNV